MAMTQAYPDFSAYTLDLPNSPDVFPTFHVSVLKHHHANDPELFPSRKFTHLGPTVTTDRVKEY